MIQNPASATFLRKIRELFLFSSQGHGYVSLFRTVRLSGITDSTFVIVIKSCIVKGPIARCNFSCNLSRKDDSRSIVIASEGVLRYATQSLQLVSKLVFESRSTANIEPRLLKQKILHVISFQSLVILRETFFR